VQHGTPAALLFSTASTAPSLAPMMLQHPVPLLCSTYRGQGKLSPAGSSSLCHWKLSESDLGKCAALFFVGFLAAGVA